MKALFDPHLDLLLKKFILLRDENKLEEANKAAEALLRIYPDNKAILLSVGYFFWDYESIEKAVGIYKHAVDLFPDSKLASLSYFHVLWKTANHLEALAEAERFISDHDCSEYNELIADLSSGMKNG